MVFVFFLVSVLSRNDCRYITSILFVRLELLLLKPVSSHDRGEPIAAAGSSLLLSHQDCEASATLHIPIYERETSSLVRQTVRRRFNIDLD